MSPDPLDSDLLELEAELRQLRPVDPHFGIFQAVRSQLEPPLSAVAPQLATNGVGNFTAGAAWGVPQSASGAVPSRRWRPTAIAAAACAVGVSAGMWVKNQPQNTLATGEPRPKALATIEPEFTIPQGFQFWGSFTLVDSAQPGTNGPVQGTSLGSAAPEATGWVKERLIFINPSTGEKLQVDRLRPSQTANQR